MNPEVHDRRREDRRLIELEHAVSSAIEQLRELQTLVRSSIGQIASIESRLGDSFTTLIIALDQRYMPRTEMELAYVPRKEHERHQTENRSWRWQIPVAIAALTTAGVQVYLLLHGAH